MDKGSIDFEHKQCLHEYDFGVIQNSISNTDTNIAEIKSDQKAILAKINGLPDKLKAQDKSIGRLWKVVYIALASAGAAVATALKN